MTGTAAGVATDALVSAAARAEAESAPKPETAVPQSAALGTRAARFFQRTRRVLVRFGHVVVVLSLLAFVILLLSRAVSPSEWEFSVDARTDVVEIHLQQRGETRWRIDGALVCARGELRGAEGVRRPGANAGCGSDLWNAYAFPEPELALVLDGAVRAGLETRADGSLAMTLRKEGGGKLGRIESSSGAVASALGGQVNVIWYRASAGGLGHELVLPFTGAALIGRDVAWSGNGLLRHGSLSVYSGDDSADRRTRVDEATLLLGDQVQLGSPEVADASGAAPVAKGFVQWSPSVAGPLQVVAFGRSEEILVRRFGDKGYAFAPGILDDPRIGFWGAVAVAVVGFGVALIAIKADVAPAAKGETRGTGGQEP